MVYLNIQGVVVSSILHPCVHMMTHLFFFPALCSHVYVSCFLFQYKPEEIAAIMKDFDEPGSLAPTGLFLGGTKYMVIQGEPGVVIRGKKGTGGITVKKTNLAIIIGIYDEPMTGGQCNMIVERLGDYLFDQGY